MDYSKEQLILFSAQQGNILPLTSVCNVRCIFCSHPQNPEGVKVFGIHHRSIEEIEITLEFLNPEEKIVIGESVTKIMEGEPFLHPDIKTILKIIRKKFPRTKVQITTNGTLLTDDILDLLQDLKNIELYISLNSASKQGRNLLMGDLSETVFKAIPQLWERKIPFSGSIVALPWIVGWDDLEQTVKFLNKYHAETIRIFMPGYTKKAPRRLKFDPDFPQKLHNWVERIRKIYRIPIMLEPAMVDNLKVIVDGVIRNSPAERAGFVIGDEIIKIERKIPFSRVDAFHTLLQDGFQNVKIIRNGNEQVLKILKEPGERPGLVFAYDFSLEVYYQIKQRIKQKQVKNPLILCSVLAEPLFKILVQSLNEELDGVRVKVISVRNSFFGGSIMSAGLLVIQDIEECLADYKKDFDLLLIPGIFLDHLGNDLVGRNVMELRDKLKGNLEIIDF